MTYFTTIFCSSGDKKPIPMNDDNVDNVSWYRGYTLAYTNEKTSPDDGRYVSRENINYIFNRLTSLVNILHSTKRDEILDQYYVPESGDIINTDNPRVVLSIDDNNSTMLLGPVFEDTIPLAELSCSFNKILVDGDLALFNTDKITGNYFWHDVTQIEITKEKNPVLYSNLQGKNQTVSMWGNKLKLKSFENLFFHSKTNSGEDAGVGIYSPDTFPRHNHTASSNQVGAHSHLDYNVYQEVVRDVDRLGGFYKKGEVVRVLPYSLTSQTQDFSAPHTHKLRAEGMTTERGGRETRPRNHGFAVKMFSVNERGGWEEVIKSFIQKIRV